MDNESRLSTETDQQIEDGCRHRFEQDRIMAEEWKHAESKQEDWIDPAMVDTDSGVK